MRVGERLDEIGYRLEGVISSSGLTAAVLDRYAPSRQDHHWGVNILMKKYPNLTVPPEIFPLNAFFVGSRFHHYELTVDGGFRSYQHLVVRDGHLPRRHLVEWPYVGTPRLVGLEDQVKKLIECLVEFQRCFQPTFVSPDGLRAPLGGLSTHPFFEVGIC